MVGEFIENIPFSRFKFGLELWQLKSKLTSFSLSYLPSSSSWCQYIFTFAATAKQATIIHPQIIRIIVPDILKIFSFLLRCFILLDNATGGNSCLDKNSLFFCFYKPFCQFRPFNLFIFWWNVIQESLPLRYDTQLSRERV